MRIFIAGASGVIGARIVPLLVEQGHVVGGMTRSPDKVDRLRELGAEPVVCDVYDAPRLTEAVAAFAPDLVMHQLTDLPDDRRRIALYMRRNNRISTEGTRNLLAAGRSAGVQRFIAQSIAFTPPGVGRAVKRHERMVLDAGGVVLRYGWLYGPGTYSETSRGGGALAADPRRCSRSADSRASRDVRSERGRGHRGRGSVGLGDLALAVAFRRLRRPGAHREDRSV